MNRALLWKEFREQGLIVAALVILGGGILVAAGLIFPSPSNSSGFSEMRNTTEPRKLAVVLLVLASGVVVGGTLFAGEREQGTFPYLELLPVPRWRVWLGKVIAGLILTLIAAGLLFAVGAAVGVIGPPGLLPFWALITATLAVAAFSWGALGSSFAKTSLAACGLGILFSWMLSIPIAVAVGVGVALLDRVVLNRGSNSDTNRVEWILLGTLFGTMVIPLLLSGWIYTSPDRNRFSRDVRTARGGPVDPVPRRLIPKFLSNFGIKASFWVVFRQNFVLAMVLGSVALVSGVSFLQPALPVMFVWPVATLLLGTIVGVTGWSDEQNSGAFRFWAERRMPLGKLWLAKIAYGLGLVTLLVLILAAPAIIAASAAGQGPTVPMAFRSKVMQDRTFPFVEYIALWPIYGFAFGHLAGLIFRKAAVGTAVGLMTGGAIVAFWLPSLFAGGVHWYQLWIPPLLALVTARSLIWSWALDQLGGTRALLRLGSGSAAVVLAMVAGIAYRILEIPDGDNGNADLAYRQTIPPFETNDAGREIRRAAVLFTEAKANQRAEPEPWHEPLWPEGPSQRETANLDKYQTTYFYQLSDTLTLGWPENRPDADLWFDTLMANCWAESLVAAAKMPLGTVEDPSELNVNSPFRHLNALQGIETVLLARGLQLQAKGKPEAFVEAAAATLGLTRNLRNKSFFICGLVSVRMENQLHLAIQRWLEKLGDRPDLLKEMLALLQRHEATCPKFAADGNLPEQTTLRNSINAPTQFVKQHLQFDYPSRSRNSDEETAALENEVELVGFAWAVPWEKERLRRLVGLGNNRELDRAEAEMFRGLPGLSFYPRDQNQFSVLSITKKRPDLEVTSLANRRASMLLVALRLYQSEKGKLPASLEALVPKYLPAVPQDPFDQQPFRYRISLGETLQMEQLPAPAPMKPITLGALVGGPGIELESNRFLYPVSPIDPPEPPEPETFGGLLGGAGFTIESDPYAFKLMDPTFPPGGTGATGVPGILLPEFRMLDVPTGRGILWSVGPDRLDDGGKRLFETATSTTAIAALGDLIFVVPTPAEAKR